MSSDIDNYKLKTSKKLIEMKNSISDDSISIKELISLLLDDGIYLLVIILIAPFIIPVSIPGSSTVFGVLIILLEISFLFNKPLYLPKRVGNYVLSKESIDKLFNILNKALRYIEKISRPRGKLTSNKYILKFNAIITILLSLLLFLPIPIPLTDFIPAIGILILAISSLEDDVYLMLLGYLVTIGAFFYFASVGYLGIEAIQLVLDYFNIHI